MRKKGKYLKDIYQIRNDRGETKNNWTKMKWIWCYIGSPKVFSTISCLCLKFRPNFTSKCQNVDFWPKLLSFVLIMVFVFEVYGLTWNSCHFYLKDTLKVYDNQKPIKLSAFHYLISSQCWNVFITWRVKD